MIYQDSIFKNKYAFDRTYSIIFTEAFCLLYLKKYIYITKYLLCSQLLKCNEIIIYKNNVKQTILKTVTCS